MREFGWKAFGNLETPIDQKKHNPKNMQLGR
jgi:hypothetical protein